MKKLLALATIATLYCTSSFACEESDKKIPKHEKMLEKIDSDGDKVVSKKEWKKESERKFKELDSDNDGKVTEDEFKTFHEKMREKFKDKKDKKSKAE